MAIFEFNRNALQYGEPIEQPTQEQIKDTLALWNCSLEDALKYGGDLTRAAIGAMDLKFDKKHIIVDTKIHMLMPNMYPAIPSWHSDGVPRGADLNPTAKAEPNILAQDDLTDTRFHLLVTGEGCLTQFIDQRRVQLEVPTEPSAVLYGMVNDQLDHGVGTGNLDTITVPTCTPVMFDWHDLHRGVKATQHEWRFLIRVTETDHMEPQTDLRKIIRTQQQVYTDINFSW